MKLLITSLATLAAVAAAGCSNSLHESKLRAALAGSTVSLRDTVAIAEGAMTGAVAVKARLRVDAEPVYAISAVAAGSVTDVRIAPVGGSVLSTAGAGSWSSPACPGAISLAQTIAIAEGAVGGQAVAIEPDDDGACNREVQVLTAGELWEVKVGPSGAIVETEISDESDD